VPLRLAELPCIGFAGWHRKSVPVSWQMLWGLFRGQQGGKASWMASTDHGKVMAAYPL